jgi:hypothetical protein
LPRAPSLINSADGLTRIDGMTVEGPFFNENLPLRNSPRRVNTIAGAIDIQRVVDGLAWAEQASNTVAIAPVLRRAPPAGVRARPFIIQIARSDPSSTNPTTTAIIRSGALEDRAVLYRHDLNFGRPGVPVNSHLFISSLLAPPDYSRVALGAQEQIATFYASDGARVIHPAPTELWEVPIRSPLPEDLLYLPRPR